MKPTILIALCQNCKQYTEDMDDVGRVCWTASSGPRNEDDCTGRRVVRRRVHYCTRCRADGRAHYAILPGQASHQCEDEIW